MLLLLLLLLFYCDFITNVINKSVSIYYKKFSLSLEKLNHDLIHLNAAKIPALV